MPVPYFVVWQFVHQAVAALSAFVSEFAAVAVSCAVAVATLTAVVKSDFPNQAIVLASPQAAVQFLLNGLDG